ncbi:FMN-binding protein [Undibacterium sp. RTI2.1]|uniref:FMN-binding protein n=1 Tax=unclassified Undibacterium TaxID=2630295 RepID=UPI002AB41D32|nr:MULTISPECIES: FMN-binding protein [unclassified Undibacterium]MDY7538236.1 FMN-binding protein [Undibacterium sp. 5I1]MEB0030883.1 FMN-binding protein [Undibacterium sp. RTI2.1]MEB0117440.1 FMN-binding protein [Undibacterium sp. RTI2.2]MEB0229491.1 FMN-binding protein [Undibacterium sp. 10I3]MEB0256102.1 FMN-binding protein [Undibacterium sp. 5I1]
MKTTAIAPLVLMSLAGMNTSAFATQYLTAEQAQKVMFPDATEFKSATLQLTLDQMQQIEKLAGLPARSAAWRTAMAYKDGKLIGYIVLDDVVGKFELISYAVGLLPDASVKQIEILNYRESHGAEIRNTNWRQQFVGKSASAGLRIGEGISNISGATLSCTHVTDGARRIAAVAQVAMVSTSITAATATQKK